MPSPTEVRSSERRPHSVKKLSRAAPAWINCTFEFLRPEISFNAAVELTAARNRPAETAGVTMTSARTVTRYPTEVYMHDVGNGR